MSIKRYREFFESSESQLWELEDLCQEIKDEGFFVSIRSGEWGKSPESIGSAKIEISNGSRIGTGISGTNFTMVQPLKDFLLRIRDWAREEGYSIYARSNYGILNITEDGRILGSGCTCTPRYPSFTMLEINFAR